MTDVILIEKLITGRTPYESAPSRPVPTSRNGVFLYTMQKDFGIDAETLVNKVNAVPGRLSRDGQEFKYSVQSLMSGLFVRSWLSAQWGHSAIAWRAADGTLRLGAIPASGDPEKDRQTLIKRVQALDEGAKTSKPKTGKK